MTRPRWAERARGAWTHTGRARPPFALEPGPGQESVWDYPRPPALVREPRGIVVATADGREIARCAGDERHAWKLCETASPPTYYLPPESVRFESLVRTAGRSRCEWKGEAWYWALADAPDGPTVAWSYPAPFGEYRALEGHVAFYPGRVRCTLGGESVRAQAGDYYGGWITDDVVGPFKGDPGTGGW